MFFKKKNQKAVNEFNQVVEGNSLTKDAWKRLRKNKMAVIGMVVVIFYALIALSASILPIYRYDEIILDHQNLPPSLTKTAGELMMKNRLQSVYFDAWKAGELKVTEEESRQINEWIQKNESTKVWNWMYAEGERQREAGTFTFNKSAQRIYDRLVKKINTDLLVSVTKAWYVADSGKRVNLKKMSADELARIYADMLGMDKQVVADATDKEVETALVNDLKAKNPDMSDEDANASVAMEMESRGDKAIERMKKTNLYGKIILQGTKSLKKSLEAKAAEGSIKFPFNETTQVNDHLILKVKATKMHERRYLLGTDYVGRDMLSRVIYGGQVSISIGLVGAITSVLIGILVGSLAGYLGGKIDYVLMRFVDIMYGLPYMLLVIICMAIFGRNIMNLFIALAMVSWLTIARMVRGQIMSLKNSEFVEAARSMGASTARIIVRHMIPNSLSVIIVYTTLRVPSFIMQESFLSFLGLGVSAPFTSWGSLVGDAVDAMTLYPWRLLFPAAVMTVFLFAMNFFGDGLRDAFDPQSKNQQ